MVVNEDATNQNNRGALTFFAGKPAPTEKRTLDAKRARQDAGLAAVTAAMPPKALITKAPRYNQQSPGSHSYPGNS